MNGGRIEQLGPPAELYELPRTAFVANFLGQSNLVPGTVTGRTGDVLDVECMGRRLQLPVDRAVSDSGRVLIGVRPEKVHLMTDDEELPYGTNVLGPGTIADVSFAGVSTQFLVDLPGGLRLTVFSQNLQAGPTARTGEQVHLAWAAQHTFGLAGDEDTHAGLEEIEAELAAPAEAT
jgi:spermidine/putrescine transport system ATP-binding protein